MRPPLVSTIRSGRGQAESAKLHSTAMFLKLFQLYCVRMNRLPFEEFKYIYSKVPRLTVEIVLIKDGGIVLSLRNIAPYKGFWHVPGGTVLYREKIEDAVKRIANDELDVNVELENLLGYWQVPEWLQPGGFSSPIGLVYKVKLLSGELKGNSQSSEIKIFRRLPDNMIEEQKQFLEKLTPF